MKSKIIILMTLLFGQVSFMEANCQKKETASQPEKTAIATFAGGCFWCAEEYHQDFYCKNPVRYKGYRTGSGRDAFIEKVWGPGSK